MFMIFLYALKVDSCEVWQVQHDEGCIDICKGMYYNTTSSKCEDFQECEKGEYLSIVNNTCIGSCANGYYDMGVCVCYAGWKISNSKCVADQEYSTTNNYVLGLDWFYWGLGVLIVINCLYVGICYLKIKKKAKKLVDANLSRL